MDRQTDRWRVRQKAVIQANKSERPAACLLHLLHLFVSQEGHFFLESLESIHSAFGSHHCTRSSITLRSAALLLLDSTSPPADFLTRSQPVIWMRGFLFFLLLGLDQVLWSCRPAETEETQTCFYRSINFKTPKHHSGETIPSDYFSVTNNSRVDQKDQTWRKYRGVTKLRGEKTWHCVMLLEGQLFLVWGNLFL